MSNSPSSSSLTTERPFPVLWQGRREYMARLVALDCPRSVPWGFIEAKHRECIANHDQTPEVLASRGGLGPEEIVALYDGTETWTDRRRCWAMPPDESVPRLFQLVRAYAEESTDAASK